MQGLARSLRKAGADQRGFTLTELLVVIVIIGILVGIAVPVFLSQRERAFDAAAQSDLRNAATAQETHYISEDTYAEEITDLEDEGFVGSENVTVTVVSADGNGYCMESSHENSETTFHMSSDSGSVDEGGCASADDAGES